MQCAATLLFPIEFRFVGMSPSLQTPKYAAVQTTPLERSRKELAKTKVSHISLFYDSIRSNCPMKWSRPNGIIKETDTFVLF